MPRPIVNTFMRELVEAVNKYPHMRIGQLLDNAYYQWKKSHNSSTQFYYLKDTDLVIMLREYRP